MAVINADQHKSISRPVQNVLYCPCGNVKVHAKGLCATCYTLRRQDETHFGGRREAVLARDGRRCRIPGCTTVKRGKRSLAVHHRRPGSSPAKMITLCLACHARVTRTLCLAENWPEMLRVLWREQHPDCPEQSALNFAAAQAQRPAAGKIPLFRDAEEFAAIMPV